MPTLLYKKRLISFCKEKGIACEAHSQFGNGDAELLENPILIQIAKNHNKSVRQVILHWLIQQKIIVIPRSSNPKNIVSNIDVFNFNLSDDEMVSIDGLNKNKSFIAWDMQEE